MLYSLEPSQYSSYAKGPEMEPDVQVRVKLHQSSDLVVESGAPAPPALDRCRTHQMWAVRLSTLPCEP